MVIIGDWIARVLNCISNSLRTSPLTHNIRTQEEVAIFDFNRRYKDNFTCFVTINYLVKVKVLRLPAVCCELFQK